MHDGPAPPATETVDVADATDLRDLIYRRMRELGISQAEVARRAGISPAGMSKIMTGGNARIPDLDMLDRIADALALPQRFVRRVAAASYGYVVSEPDEKTDLMVAGFEELSEQRRKDIADLIGLYLRESKPERGNRDQSDPDG